MPNFISEDQIEQALLQRLQQLFGYDALNCFTAQPDDLHDGSGRSDKREVILLDRLRDAVQRLNPHVPLAAQAQAVAQLAQTRRAMSLVAANREVDALLRDGVQVHRSVDARQGAAAVEAGDQGFAGPNQEHAQRRGACAAQAHRRLDARGRDGGSDVPA